jgi:hypothetical protein
MTSTNGMRAPAAEADRSPQESLSAGEPTASHLIPEPETQACLNAAHAWLAATRRHIEIVRLPRFVRRHR